MYHTIKVGERLINSIDWEMTPDLTFGTFESWGGRERVRNNNERIHYFFVDNWGDQPKLCLMERGVKYAEVIAEIKAPLDLIRECVKNHGKTSFYERSLAIDARIKQWLIDTVLDDGDARLVEPIRTRVVAEDMGPQLPVWDGQLVSENGVDLPAGRVELDDREVVEAIKKWGFYDLERNPDGSFENALYDSGSGTLVDLRTGLMWQSGGIDITSHRLMEKRVVELNDNGYAGFHDWRLPSLEEAMSLMNDSANFKGDYLNPNFSKEQPFIFVSATRKPGGYWFVDFRHGRAFWSSGTIPGAFGRLCRSLK